MPKLYQRVTGPLAQSPGTVIYRGEKRVEAVALELFDYDAETLRETRGPDLELPPPGRGHGVTWLDVDGLHDTDLLGRIGKVYGLHPLVLEDVVNLHHRPKLEDYGGYLYIVLRMLSFDREEWRLDSEQISLVVGDGFVVTFQERPGDVLEPVRERLRREGGRIRQLGADYLGYALIDAVVDHYFHVLEGMGEAVEDLEEELLGSPARGTLELIHQLKRESILLRRSVAPLRDVASSLARDELPLIGAEVQPFLRDLYDHVIHVIDTVDSFRDILSGLQDLYLSNVSNRMNDVMKVLTIFTTLFVPLTFIAGVYGMNFEHMPELAWRWSYPLFWGMILVLAVVMLIFFRRRRWL
ncbi:MAG TPA: magnesium/cobalt transporter CorA [Candidatus Krumholzibacteria bacterium]|nr:magnesium/cobalt transporter CorA [Candidatus Krumholzibacteria bacterium]